jgi:hypothetical protein
MGKKVKKEVLLVETPREKSQRIKNRLAGILKRLPEYWISAFVHIHPEYNDKRQHLSNVAAGRSLDENVIGLMEDLATRLTPSKPTAKK